MANYGNLQMPLAIVLVMTCAAIFQTASCNRCKRRCGLRPAFPNAAAHRIIGGRRAKRGEIPWQVYVKVALEHMDEPSVRESLICGGSIINEKWILAAAHCFYDYILDGVPPDAFQVVSNNLNRRALAADRKAQVRLIKRWFMHERYNNETGNNDIALLELRLPLVFDNFTQPICLAREGDHFTGMMCKSSGWGQKKPTLEKPGMHLKTVDLPVIDMERCKRYHSPAEGGRYAFPYTSICTLYESKLPTRHKSSCVGDSGGPLSCPMEDGRFVLAGVIISSTCQPNYPDIHSRVSAYFGWIHEITGVDFE